MLLTQGSRQLQCEELFTAKVYQQGTNKKLLFVKRNRITKKGNKTILTHLYTNPNGKMAAFEEVTLINNILVNYLVEMPLSNCGCLLTKQGNKFTFLFTRGKKKKKGKAPYRNNIVVGPTLTDFVGKKWNTLQKGKKVYFMLPAMSLQRMAQFYLQKNLKSKYNRKGVTVIQMNIANVLFRVFVSSVDLVYDNKTKKVLEIHGKSLLQKKINGKIVNPIVDIYYKY